MNKTLSRNFLAQIYSQIVTFAVQLGALPLLIHAWGIEGFGVWMLLTAIPAYLAFSDFGFTFIAKNDMAMRVSRKDREGALETFQSILVLLLIVGGALFAGLALLVWTAPLDSWFNLGGQTLRTARDVLLFQIASALLYQIFLLMSSGVRCEGRAALETTFAATARLAETAAVVTTAIAGFGLAQAALSALCVRAVALVAMTLWLRRSTPWLKIGYKTASLVRLKELFLPSISYMAVPISNALLIQAPVILLGIIASPATVALYSVTRTVARFGMSAANMVNYSFTPEYSFAYGRNDFDSFRKLWHRQLWVILAGTAIFAGLSPWLLPFGIRLVSNGTIIPELSLVMTIACAVVFEMLWSAAFAPLSAVNRHRTVALALLGLSGIAIFASSLGTNAVIIAALVATAHALTFVVTVLQLKRFLATLPRSVTIPQK